MTDMLVHVRLDWLISVRGAVDKDDAFDQAYTFAADQELEEQLEIEVVDEAEPGEEITTTLYPDNAVVPADEQGPWATYHRE